MRDSCWKRVLKTVVSRKMTRTPNPINHLTQPERIDPPIRTELCGLISAGIRVVGQELKRAIPTRHTEGHVP